MYRERRNNIDGPEILILIMNLQPFCRVIDSPLSFLLPLEQTGNETHLIHGRTHSDRVHFLLLVLSIVRVAVVHLSVK